MTLEFCPSTPPPAGSRCRLTADQRAERAGIGGGSRLLGADPSDESAARVAHHLPAYIDR